MHYRLTVTLADGTVNYYLTNNRAEVMPWYHGFKTREPIPVRLTLHRIDGSVAYQMADWQRDRNTVTVREVITPNA